MNRMSEREYSSHFGLSRGAIHKARNGRQVVVYGDGSINAAASDARRSVMIDPDQHRRTTCGNSSGDSCFSAPSDILS